VLEHAEPRGSLQHVGGNEYGHKGFGLALMIEALSQGLSGHGRADAPARWGGNVFLQVIDPAFFAGRDAFIEQTDHLSRQCRANRPIDPARPVRMPGDQAARLEQQARAQGIAYAPAAWEALAGWARRLGVELPATAATVD
jgi:L-lactate dehydrogenase